MTLRPAPRPETPQRSDAIHDRRACRADVWALASPRAPSRPPNAPGVSRSIAGGGERPASGFGRWMRPEPRKLPGTDRATYPVLVRRWTIASRLSLTAAASNRSDRPAATDRPSPDRIRGRRLVGERHILFGPRRAGLFRVAAAGGNPMPITTPEGERLASLAGLAARSIHFLYRAGNGVVYRGSIASATGRSAC